MILAKLFGMTMLVGLGVALAANGNAQPSQQGPQAPTPEASARQGAEARVEPVLSPRRSISSRP